MNRFLCSLALLPFLSATALAQPVQLSEIQMDTVSAGWDLQEQEMSNTSWSGVSIYHPNNEHVFDGCSSCYLVIESKAISVASAFLN